MGKSLPFLAVLTVMCLSQPSATPAGGTVESVRFETKATPPVYVIPRALQQNEALFRA
jgi:hypothetical protein